MSSIVIEISELRNKHKERIKELAEFLEGKLGVEIDVSEREVKVESEAEALSRAYLRVLLRKFLHKQKLKEDFRVISGPEGALVIKERRFILEE